MQPGGFELVTSSIQIKPGGIWLRSDQSLPGWLMKFVKAAAADYLSGQFLFVSWLSVKQ
jgi:hypothetical protein